MIRNLETIRSFQEAASEAWKCNTSGHVGADFGLQLTMSQEASRATTEEKGHGAGTPDRRRAADRGGGPGVRRGRRDQVGAARPALGVPAGTVGVDPLR